MKIPLAYQAAAAVALCLTPGLAPAQTTALLGDAGGLRPALAAHGITLSANDSENLLGNTVGGVKQGATMQGVTTLALQIDTAKAFNLPGGTINISAVQLHGRVLSPYYLSTLQTANGNESDNATRLWELWLDQRIGNADVKLGQQSIDNEFITSTYSALFVNTAAGWPLLPTNNMYAGGPAFPLSSLGVRLRDSLNPSLTLLAGVFDDNPPGKPFANDPQSKDAGGLRFNLNTGALFIAEAQFASAQTATYKLGLWYDTAAFPDQEYGTDGLSLANTASNGTPVFHHGNMAVYGVGDQTIWQNSAGQALSLFGRVEVAPQTDENLIGWSFNTGLSLAAPFIARPHDTAGLDISLGQISPRAAGLDRDTGLYTGTSTPIRGTEALFELTYQAQATPWLTMQPVVQWVVHPGAGINNPAAPGQVLKNEVVAGVRAVTSF
jgi:porin